MNAFEGVPNLKTSRRGFLGLLGFAVLTPVLASCTTAAGSGSTAAGGGPIGIPKGVLPNYVPVEYVTPDIPGIDGSTPGFLEWPKLVKSVDKVPGVGGSYTAMTPTYGNVVPGLSDSKYLQQVNDEIGAKFDFRFTDNNAYPDKLQAIFASAKDVPDFVTIAEHNIPARFDQALPGLFQDMGEYLSGDKVEKYPNLANIPTNAWKSCVFEGKLYGLPYPSDRMSGSSFYRKDLFDEMGITEMPKNADEFFDLTVEITDEKAGRWAGNDLSETAKLIYAVPPKWKRESGKLVHKYESDEYRGYLEFTAKLFAAGVIHPDAVAGNSGENKARFESGKVLLTYDGYSGWIGSHVRTVPTTPTYNQQPLPWFVHDGSTPRFFVSSPAKIMTFVKKQDDPARMDEILDLLNYIAAPFGTTEQALLQNGFEGVHWEADPDTGAPVKTELGLKEVASTYQWLVRPPVTQNAPQYPDVVTDYCNFMADSMQYGVEPEFYGMQILEPVRLASLSQPFNDLESDIVRGRKSLDDLDAAITTWKNSGGDELREFYAGYLDV